MNAQDSLDVQIGRRIQRLRCEKNFSQKKLAMALGISFQQIQKYERGTNRVGAARLYEIAKVLSVPIYFFYNDLSCAPSSESVFSTGMCEAQEPFHSVCNERKGNISSGDKKVNNFLFSGSQETYDLVQAYHRIPSASVRRQVLELIQSLAEKHQPSG